MGPHNELTPPEGDDEWGAAGPEGAGPEGAGPGSQRRQSSSGAGRHAGAVRNALRGATAATWRHLDAAFGGPARSRVVVLLAFVLALNSADTATVGAAATQLRQALHIDNVDIGVLVAVTAVVAAVASVPFGVLVDRVHRVALLSITILLWGAAMLASATVSSFGSLLVVRLFLGAATAAAGPAVASLVGDYFPPGERGKIYGYILSGELVGAGIGFVITGDVSSLSWRAAFVVLALPAGLLAWLIARLPEPARGGASWLRPGAKRVVGRRELRARGATGGESATGDESAAGAGDGIFGEATDVQRLVSERGIAADPRQVLRTDPRRMRIGAAVRYVISIRTNVVLVAAGACAYFFLAGVETFGLEFARDQYRVSQVLASSLMLVVGVGALLGVLVGGRLGDYLVRRGHIAARLVLPGVAALATVVLFVPALITGSLLTALPYISGAGFFLMSQNPPLDAARLDIMPPLLWGRAEGIRTFVRTGAQALAPLAFGGLADVLGGGHTGLRITFLVMLAPFTASGVILLRGVRRYPRDVATAAASRSYELHAAPSRRKARSRWWQAGR